MVKRLNNKIIMDRINEKYETGKWTLLSEDREYKNVHMHHLFRCNECGNSYEKRVNDLLHGYGCSYCKNLGRYTIDEMKEKIIKEDKNYRLLSDHFRTRDKAIFLHLECNNKFEMVINNFTSNKERCPYCSKNLVFIKGKSRSRGVKKIEKFLLENQINFEVEKRFENCLSSISKIKLPFDFYLTDRNILIEFDGIQHFKPISYFGGEKSFERIKINDSIKNNFCHENQIELIRINYKEVKNIENILRERIL